MLKQTFLCATALAGVLAVAPPAFGQSYQQPSATSQATESITVRPATPMRARFYMPRQEVREVRGQYMMEDGSTANVDARQRSLIVDFDNRTTVLEAVGAYVFSSNNDDMTLVYTKDSLGDDIIVLSYIPQASVAMGEAARVRLSSR